jgi:hypothetical protein
VPEEKESDWEKRLRELASRLFFTLRKEGSRFRLCREADVSQPVRHEGLTLDEVEETLTLGSFADFMAAERDGVSYPAQAGKV